MVVIPTARRHDLRSKTLVFALIVIVANVSGNLMLSVGMRQVGRTLSPSPLPYLAAMLNPFVALGVCLLAIWLIATLSLLSWADLSYVLPVTAVAYVLNAVAGHFALGEHVSVPQWCGVVTITAGAILVGRTKPTTTSLHPDIDE